MKITKIEMTAFGKFQNRTIPFHAGCNLIYGPNESGKSTIHTFLAAMLFGLDPSRGRGVRNSLYQRYLPWNTPGAYGGKLWFEKDGHTYRIERSFLKENRSLALVDETEGAALEPAEETLAALLAPMTETTFRNTLLIRQMQAAPDGDFAPELQNYSANLATAQDAQIDLKAAVQSLNTQAKEIKKQIPSDTLAKKMQLEQQLLEKKNALQTIEQEAPASASAPGDASSRLQALLSEQAALKAEEASDTSVIPRLRTIPGFFRVLFPALTFLCVLASLGSYFFYDSQWTLPILGAGWFFLLVTVIVELIARRQDRRQDAIHAEIDRRSADRQKQIHALGDQIAQLSQSKDQQIRLQEQKSVLLRQLKEQISQLEQQIGQLSESLAQEKQMSEELDALELAKSRINELSRQVQSSYSPKLREDASALLSQLTNGRYSDMVFDEQFHLSLNTSDRLIPVEQLSRGTMEQAYLALRIASVRLLCPEEPLPFLLDDVFAYYDDDRLRSALDVLQHLDTQVILFSCHRRESQIMKELLGQA